MTFNFTVKEFILGGGTGTPTLQFYRRGFNLGGSTQPSWRDVILSGTTALTLVNSKADGLNYLKLFGGTELLPETYLDTVTLDGGCEQRNLPSEYTQVEYVTNTAQTLVDTGVKFDFSKNYEIELRVRGVTGSWYVFQAKEVSGSEVWGISGSTSGETIRLAFGSTASVTSQITRVNGNIYYIKATINNGNLTLYVKDETAGTEDTATGTYTVTTGQSPNMCLFGNLTGQYVGINSNVYFARIKEDGNYILNYVPCKQSTTAGFYDKATNTLKTASYLSAGADVTTPSPDTPMNIWCNNGAIKVNLNLYSTEYHDSTLSQTDGVTVTTNTGTRGVNVSSMIDCRTIKSFIVTAENPTGSYRLYKYNSSKSFIDASTTSNIGDVLTLDSAVGYFRIQYNYASINTQNILIYNSAYSLNGIYTDGTQEVVTDSLGNTASAEMLLAVGDYKDTQEVLNGSITRNIGIKVLDGTEDWVQSSTKNDVYRLFDTSAKKEQMIIYSTHFVGTDLADVNMPSNSLKQATYSISSVLYSALAIRLTDVTTLSDFKIYLAQQYSNGTPVILTYVLGSSTSESVSGQALTKSPVTQTAGSIDNLPIAVTESSHTVPTPTQPLDINCNNGVVKVSKNLFDYEYFYDNYMVPSTSTVGRVAIKLLPNTNYTVSTNTQQSSTAAQVWTATGSDPNAFSPITTTNGVLIDSPRTIQSDSNGYIILAIRVGTEYEIKESDFESGNVWVQIEQGSTVTPYTPYSATGYYIDGTTEKVEVFGNNLIDLNAVTDGYYYNPQGVYSSSATSRLTDYISIEAGVDVKVYFKSLSTTGVLNVRINIFDNNKVWQSQEVLQLEPETDGTKIITPTANGYIRVSGNYSGLLIVDWNTASISTSLGTATAENLFKVGTYQDEQSVIDGGVIHRCGIKVLDGTETWNVAGSVHNGVSRNNFYMMFNDAIATGTDTITCSIASWAQTVVSNYSAPVCRISNTKNFNIVPYEDTTTIPNVASWKQFLASQYNAGQPVIIVYPLAESTTETVTAQPLSIQAGTNIVEITQASMDDLELEVSYKAVV